MQHWYVETIGRSRSSRSPPATTRAISSTACASRRLYVSLCCACFVEFPSITRVMCTACVCGGTSAGATVGHR